MLKQVKLDKLVKQAHQITQIQQHQYHDPSFSQAVITWQKQFGRHALPWQNTDDAYRVWLSEIMLQQTQVTAVIPYYQKFLQKFPSVFDLASAPSEEVMAMWSGLGYYTRARNLHQCAKIIVSQYQGQFPDDPALLQALPGIGRSTAAAVSAFSYGTKAAILDGNVKRVFARVFGIDAYPGLKLIEDDLWLRAQALLPETDIQSYTQGLMDLGATLCTRSKPECTRCPLQSRCNAVATHRTDQLPVRKPKKVQKEKQATMLVILHDDHVLLEMRPDSGIWGGLYSLPELDGMQAVEVSAQSSAELENTVLQKKNPHTLSAESERFIAQFGIADQKYAMPSRAHVFTHFKLHIAPLCVILKSKQAHIAQPQYTWHALNNIHNIGLPAPIKTLLLSL